MLGIRPVVSVTLAATIVPLMERAALLSSTPSRGVSRARRADRAEPAVSRLSPARPGGRPLFHRSRGVPAGSDVDSYDF
jgi:hypothetical protein